MVQEVAVVETVQPSGTEILESMTDAERKDWQATGEIPVRPKEVPATSVTPASEAKSEPVEIPAETKPESEPGKAAQEVEREKPTNRGDRRILELLGKNKELQAELEEFRRAKVEVKAEVKPESVLGEPSSALKTKIAEIVGKADQFETYEDMIAVIVAESIRTMTPDMVRDILVESAPETIRKVLKVEAEARETAKVQEKVTAAWMKSVKTAAGKHADYESVVDAPEMTKLIPIGSILNSILVDSELGGEILYHLANHKDEIKRISALPPIAQAREIFKLETTLSGSPAPSETEVPPPPKVLGAGEITNADAETAARERKDAGAYIKAANEREAKERQRLRR